jgi:acetyl esterase/lipase
MSQVGTHFTGVFIMRLVPFVLIASLLVVTARAETAVKELADLPYRSEVGMDEYSTERCKLDLYLPDGKKDFPTVIWFHGGGLENGDKSSARKLGRVLAEDGIALASVNYRFSPKVKFPAYIEDAAASAAWVLKQIAEHGGDRSRVCISGHSAGG